MDFVAVVDQVIALLRQRGRLTYGTLKRQFQLDDAALDDLKDELIYGQRLAADEDGRVLVWMGDTVTAPPWPQSRSTLVAASPTPPYLAEKILTSRSALEGERKQVTVLFADLKGSTELIVTSTRKRPAPLDPALQRMMDAVHRFEGTVNQVLGDGIMALFERPWRTRITPCGPVTLPWPCKRQCSAIRGGAPLPRSRDAGPSGSTRAK